MKFEWDPKKSTLNVRKHGIAFEDAILLFDKPYLEGPNERTDSSEDRFIVYGEVSDQVIALVYTWREERRRIISARKATKNEREAYYRAIYSR